jgi:hypothetical protein
MKVMMNLRAAGRARHVHCTSSRKHRLSRSYSGLAAYEMLNRVLVGRGKDSSRIAEKFPNIGEGRHNSSPLVSELW